MKNIPKICHLYWDNSPMSFLQTLTIDSFHKYNPDWKIIVYTTNSDYNGIDRYIPNYDNEDYFHLVKSKDYVEFKIVNLDEYGIRKDLHNILRSDIFRYKILYEYGGVWSDFDIIWLKPMEHLYNIEYVGDTKIDDMDGAVCMYKTISGHHNISILIHKKGCDLLKSYINMTSELQKIENVKFNHQFFGTLMLNYMYPKFQDITEKYKNIIALKYETVFPYPIFELEKLYKRNYMKVLNNNVMCVHWFNGHFLSKEYVNQSKYNDCSMTTILKNEKWI